MLLVDSNEPDEIVKLLQQSVPVTVTPLNRLHMSDYFFGNYEGKRFQFSRKQAGELLANIDEAEDQLRDYYEQADENFQIVEGIISPLRLDKIEVTNYSREPSTRDLGARMFSYKVEDNGWVVKGHSFDAVGASMLYAWIHRLTEAGIATYYTVNWAETAKLLVAVYKNEQKPASEHTTLQRITKPRIFCKSQEPIVKALMSLSIVYKIGIGEEKATSIAKKFSNLLDVAMASPQELCQCSGIGILIAEKLLKAIGREV